MELKGHSKGKKGAALPLHEWYIVLVFCLILLVLAGYALARPKSMPPIATPLPKLEEVTVLQVNIHGEVANPGTYRLPLKATLKDLLEQAEPLASADLSELKWRRRLRHEQTIHIPKRRFITIHISGAVEQPGSLEILSGTRYCELIDQLSPMPNADLSSLRKRKSFVKEGESIEVPIKNRGGKKRKKVK